MVNHNEDNKVVKKGYGVNKKVVKKHNAPVDVTKGEQIY